MVNKIVPYIGVRSLLFGMTTKDVINLIGEPNSKGPTFEVSNRFLYDKMTIDFNKEDHVLEQIIFDSADRPEFELFGCNYKVDNNLINKFEKMNLKKIDSSHYIIYTDLGISISKQKQLDDPVLLIVFCKTSNWLKSLSC